MIAPVVRAGHRQRMVSAVKKTSGGTPLSTLNYTYDVFNRRIQVADTTGGTTTTLRTVYDGANAWADYDGSNALQTRYLMGRGMDDAIARVSASGVLAWYLGDLVGSTREIANADGSAVINEVDYDSYGNILSETSPSSGDRFKYTGREMDSATDQHYYRARYYNPGAGRFHSQDPIKFAGGDANIFRYVANASTISVDPSGLQDPKTRPPKKGVPPRPFQYPYGGMTGTPEVLPTSIGTEVRPTLPGKSMPGDIVRFENGLVGWCHSTINGKGNSEDYICHAHTFGVLEFDGRPVSLLPESVAMILRDDFVHSHTYTSKPPKKSKPAADPVYGSKVVLRAINSGEIIHSAVYLGFGTVSTKYGFSEVRNTNIDDMVKTYSDFSRTDLKVESYIPK